jgi:transposase
MVCGLQGGKMKVAFKTLERYGISIKSMAIDLGVSYFTLYKRLERGYKWRSDQKMIVEKTLSNNVQNNLLQKRHNCFRLMSNEQTCQSQKGTRTAS